ncbi:uncharacterized protein PFL1_02415 [Pseudozyma flocculosa PF-1]|uniref:Related to Oxidoreductase n=1 Tax=Pseudozyma flocculosa TaxID=84751 RepID=A0A5C3F8S8_9BASI|nr:uncharacterized protein PFL1_02415 [Pseudozyma flocculosa PF-1]EPQ30299.1 hypothetical protein PFL1_02415 [Pseudozyma flocculosa PF-1]SPO39761.1 related to Oxidoreductase [Pseudozyma flocculosa]
MTAAPAPASATADSLATQKTYHLDYADWDPADPASASSRRFIASLQEAMVGHGFFYLFNSPLSHGPRREGMYDVVSRFFALPLEARQRITIDRSPHFRGYTAFGDETTQNRQDLRDQVDFGPHAPEPLPRTRDEIEGRAEKTNWKNLIGPNQYVPDDEVPGFERTVRQWFHEASRVSEGLTEAVECALGVERGRLGSYIKGKDHDEGRYQYARMKIIRYPPGQQVDGVQRDAHSRQGVGAHKDSGWLTLLSTSPVDGLEVQDLHGRWINVPYLAGSIVVNFGQQFENLSHGLIQSATHRVISNPSSVAPRYSVAWFSFPALDTVFARPLADDEIGDDIKRHYERLRGGWDVVSDVEKGDLFAKFGEEFGEVAWKGLVRSHQGVVRRWYPHLVVQS